MIQRIPQEMTNKIKDTMSSERRECTGKCGDEPVTKRQSGRILRAETVIKCLHKNHIRGRRDQGRDTANTCCKAISNETPNTYAMPKKMDLAKPRTFLDPKRCFSESTNALQFATIIRAAAIHQIRQSISPVLLTKIDNTAAVHIIPKSIALGAEKYRMIAKAIRI